MIIKTENLSSQTKVEKNPQKSDILIPKLQEYISYPETTSRLSETEGFLPSWAAWEYIRIF